MYAFLSMRWKNFKDLFQIFSQDLNMYLDKGGSNKAQNNKIILYYDNI